MKINTNHRFFAPVFNQIAELLDKDYDIDNDNTDEPLGLSLSVFSKKYKSHGLNISTHLGENPEWSINVYNRMPITLPSLGRYRFTPEKDDEGFPLLTQNQLYKIANAITLFEKDLLTDIYALIDEINSGSAGIDTESINFQYEYGFDSLIGLENYGKEISYDKFFEQIFKKSINNYRLMVGIFNSKDQKIRKYLEKTIDMYIDQMNYMSLDDAYEAARRFMTTSRSDSVLGAFTVANRHNYLDMVKKHIMDIKNFSTIHHRDIIGFVRCIDSDKLLEDEIMTWAYEFTDDESFLSQDVKDLFLF